MWRMSYSFGPSGQLPIAIELTRAILGSLSQVAVLFVRGLSAGNSCRRIPSPGRGAVLQELENAAKPCMNSGGNIVAF